jgi:ADP-heptose:LPS heptosyltransferase
LGPLKDEGHPTKNLVIIRLDAIGDYILFRNSLAVLKNSSCFQSYNFTMIGNVLWRDLALYFDDKHIDRFLWIDVKKFRKNFFYRLQILLKVADTSYDLGLQPTYSRIFSDGDSIMRALRATKKIGFTGNFSNGPEWEYKFPNRFYNELF